MKAFHNDPSIKDAFLKRVIEHRIADRIIKRVYWENGRGCAVGCTLEGNSATFGREVHLEYEKQLGIPRILAKLQDSIFEGLPKEMAIFFPEKFLTAIKVGADLSLVWQKFAVWMLTDPQHGVIKFAKSERTKILIKKVSKLYNKKINESFVNPDSFCDATAADAYAAADATYAAADATYAAAAAAAAAVTAAAYADATTVSDATTVADAYAAAYAAADAAAYAAVYAAEAYVDTYASAAAYAYTAAADAATATAADAYAAAAAADAADATDAFFKTKRSLRIAQMEKLLELVSDEVPNAPLKT